MLPALSLNAGRGDNTVEIVELTVDGRADIKASSGMDILLIQNSTFGNNLTINMGSGGSDIDIIPTEIDENATTIDIQTTIDGDLKITAGTGADDINLVGVEVGGRLSVNTGQGGSTHAYDTITIGSDFRIINRGGEDGLSATNMTIGRNVLIANGRGERNNPGQQTVLLGHATVAGNVTINNREGQDTVDIQSSDIAGNVRITNSPIDSRNVKNTATRIQGDPNDPDVTQTTIGGDLRLYNPRGADINLLLNLIVTGRTIINNNLGGSTTTIGSSTFEGGLKIFSRAGFDSLQMNDNEVVGDVIVSFGNGGIGGNNFLGAAVTLSGENIIGRDFKYGSGTGDENINITGADVGRDLAISLGRNVGLPFSPAFTSLNLLESTIGRDTTIRSRDAREEMVLTDNAFGRHLKILPGRGSSQVFINPIAGVSQGSNPMGITTIGGDLRFTGHGNDDFFLIFDSEIAGNTQVRLGNGNNPFGINNSILSGDLNVTAGAGNDIVGLERLDPPTIGPTSTFEGNVRINMGAGNNDNLVIGMEDQDSNTAIFEGDAIFIGGSGNNDMLDFMLGGNVFPIGQPEFSGFEDVI